MRKKALGWRTTEIRPKTRNSSSPSCKREQRAGPTRLAADGSRFDDAAAPYAHHCDGFDSQSSMHCIFCDIVAGTAPASIVHHDDRCMAFMDIQPVTAGHLLVIPLTHAKDLASLDSDTGGHLFRIAQRLAAAIRESDPKAEGINVFLADGAAAGQEVFHVHLHVFPRFTGDGFGLRFGPEYGQPVTRERLDRDAASISAAAKLVC